MRRFHIQIQPYRSPGMLVSATIDRFRLAIPWALVSEVRDDGVYFNIDFESRDAASDWSKIGSLVNHDACLAASCIVVCQGDHGWDDYLQLHHFDPDEPLDLLGSNHS